jgi:hypothetical protein
MSSSLRKAVGSAALLAYLALFIWAASALGAALLAQAPRWAAIPYFAAAGIVWALPLKPFLAWMLKP